MNMYDKQGYLDWDRISMIPASFIFIFGSRGIGKTYGALKYVYEKGIRFIFTRRQQQEYDIVSRDETSPFKVLNEDLKADVHLRTISKNVSGFYDGDCSLPIGYMTSLSAVAHIRGMDFSDCEWWIYDEFIPEAHVRPMKEEGQVLLNAYETFNRNRELKGRPALRMICLANSNLMANPIFMELGLVTTAERMMRSGQNYFLDKDRGLALLNPFDSPIAGEKEETALYKLINKESEYYRMAIENRFRDLDESKPRSRNLKEYMPLVRIGEITIYKHKSDRTYYVTEHHSGSCDTYTTSELDCDRCLKKYSWLPSTYLNNRIDFESYICEALFNKYLFN